MYGSDGSFIKGSGSTATHFAIETGRDQHAGAEDRKGETLVIDGAYVDGQLAAVARNTDLSRYVL